MKINFQGNDTADSGKTYLEKTGYDKTCHNKRNTKTNNAGGRADSSYAGAAVLTDFMSEGGPIWNSCGVRGREKGKSMIELQQEAGSIDVGIQQNYMTVMSNTMSEEDYAKLEEEGFHFQNMDPDDAVTIVDKIKAELAAAGQVVAGYNDDLDMNILSEAVGSETLARAVAESFAQADIPLTEDNLDQVRQAWNMASQLESPDEGAASYMIDNELETEIWNFYLAQNSGSGKAPSSDGGYFAEDIQGYYTQSAGSDMKGMQEQIDKVISQAGLEVNEESRQSASWLLDRGLPVTAQNLERLSEIRGCEFPVTEENFARAAADAIAGGRNPIHADLSGNKNIYEKAADMLSYFMSDAAWEDLGDNIAARRQLEEIRLRMTAEVNVKLLKSDFSIDTAPMEQLVEALKQAEEEIAGKYFPNDEDSVEKYRLLQETGRTVNEISAMPAQLIGTYSQRSADVTLSEFHAEGKALSDTYAKANESYEALMTAPRKDLGDSIRKAFASVDDILKDLGFECSDENRRAVRILGYNHMEITPENIEKVSAADAQVQGVIRKMTPASVLQMIRDGVNPLEKSFAQLDGYFNEHQGGYEEQSESYSRFLYQLEKQSAISMEERESYIGVFRMLRQIENSDGAAVGALVNSQAELHFSNLLSAVRSGKFRHLDVKIENAFGTVSEIVRNGESISDQIAKSFVNAVDDVLTEVSYSVETEKSYYAQELTQIRDAAHADGDAAALLQRGEIPSNAGNLLAAQELLHGEETLFGKIEKRIKRQSGQTESGKEKTADIWSKLDDKQDFKEAYGDMIDSLKTAVEEQSAEADTSIDVRDMKLIHKQLNIAGRLAANEEYMLPMYIGGEPAQVHLTIETGGLNRGSVHIKVRLSEENAAEAHFTLDNGRLSGIFIGNTEEEVTKMKASADIVSDRISRGEDGLERISDVEIRTYRSDEYIESRSGTDADTMDTDGAENIELYRVAKVFLQSIGQ